MRSPHEVQELLDRGTGFINELFRLMNKADSKNWAKLRKAFPQEAREYVNWLHDGWKQ